MNINTGAGIICYFDNKEGIIKSLEKDIIYLILVDTNNKYDFPKGAIDAGESEFHCAIRETYEESNIETSDFEFLDKNSFIENNGLRMFIGKLRKELVENYKDIIKIKANPKFPSIKEHKAFMFLSKEKASKNMLSYLDYFLEEIDDFINL